jgi:hypothetical protein
VSLSPSTSVEALPSKVTVVPIGAPRSPLAFATGLEFSVVIVTVSWLDT